MGTMLALYFIGIASFGVVCIMSDTSWFEFLGAVFILTVVLLLWVLFAWLPEYAEWT